jgi:hypothetical protein
VAAKNTTRHLVSTGNPCPFLRVLVSGGELADGQQTISNLVNTIVDAAKKGDGAPALPATAVYGTAMLANGMGPMTLLRTNAQGVKLNQLRGGPLDKQGAGSAIIDKLGVVDLNQLAGVKQFASEKTSAAGTKAQGLSLDEITTFMKANFKRTKGRRRLVDRAVMQREWPVALKVMGKDGPGGRYLSLDDVRELLVERRLPARMVG